MSYKPVITKDDLKFCLDWCVEKYTTYGNKKPKLILKDIILLEGIALVEDKTGEEKLTDGFCEFYGIYDPEENEIQISKRLTNSLKGLCETFIHEYIHFIQPEDENYEKQINPNLSFEEVEDLLDDVEHQAEYIAQKDAESLRKKLLKWRKMRLKN